MTLSSTSRQQRKSLLPKPRPSSGRRHREAGVASSDSTTSRIARRVPSPLLATSCNNAGLVAQAIRLVPPHSTTTDCNLLVPEFGPRRTVAGPPPSRIPWSMGLAPSSWSPEQSEASSYASSTGTTPSPEAKTRVDGSGNVLQYRTPPPPASAEIIKQERLVFKGLEGQGRTSTAIPAQHQDMGENRDPALAAPPARLPASTGRRRPASVSTALTLALTNGLSRVDSPLDRDGDGMSPLARKKSAVTFTSTSSSVSGKENRRPRRILARVPPPPVVPVPTIPPRSIRRSVVHQPSSRTSSPLRETSRLARPLVIRKRLPSSHSIAAAEAEDSSRSASGVSGALPVVGLVPAGIQVLIGDIDRFAKEWSEMFDELSADGAEDPDDTVSKFDASVHVRPTDQPEDAGPIQANNPVAGKGTPSRKRLLQLSSGPAASINAPQASTYGETVHLDVMRERLARWQHRDKTMVRDAFAEDKLERDLLEVASASVIDPLADGAHHLQRAVLQNASLPVTPKAARHLPSLPEINQSPTNSCSHLVEMTSVVLSNRRDELADFLESPSTVPRIDTSRHGVTKQARFYPPNGSFSPPSNVVSLSPVSAPYSSSPWINLRAPEFATPQTIRAASDALPTRTSSLRGLRAIFKRTSAGLTGGHRQRAESLKDRISEPRVLSLGSVSVSNLRNAGLASGCAEREESTMTGAGDLGQITAVK